MTQGASSRAVLMQYPYEFLYWMECTLLKMRERARIGADLTAHSIMEKRILCLCCEEAEPLMERNGEEDALKEWAFVCLEIWIGSASCTPMSIWRRVVSIIFLTGQTDNFIGRDLYKKHPRPGSSKAAKRSGCFLWAGVVLSLLLAVFQGRAAGVAAEDLRKIGKVCVAGFEGDEAHRDVGALQHGFGLFDLFVDDEFV